MILLPYHYAKQYLMHDLSLISMCVWVGMELVVWVSCRECQWSIRELYIVGVGLVLRGATHMDVSSRLAHFGVATRSLRPGPSKAYRINWVCARSQTGIVCLYWRVLPSCQEP